MVNWVTRRDLSEAAKGGAGFFALLMLAMAALFAGAWWWVSGRRLTAEPAMPQWVRVLWRAGLFVAAFALAYSDGWVGSAGGMAVFVMAALGWWLMATPDEV
ncbi:hypothetical protein ACGFLT_19775 [Micromonospora chalcea]